MTDLIQTDIINQRSTVMKKLFYIGASLAIIGLAACDAKDASKTEGQTPDTSAEQTKPLPTPKTEAEAAKAVDEAQAEFNKARERFIAKRERLDTAKAALAKFRACPADQVLKDTSVYDHDFSKEFKDQKSWFEANGKREGVVTTASGLQYMVNKKSTMKTNPPKPTDTVRVNYHGLFINGKTFDSSYDRGQDIKFPLDGVIKGWTEGVGLMRPCDAWTFYIPSDLAYGDNGRGPIPPKTPLIFYVQLLGVE
ncbi:MAG TPA: hypothetical protein ENK01_04845 [Hellea balneolensis]|uniref:Peptidyl-prolyl cis-trans isomerase n=1 Tax=Hellea balneolensis TaxID=287478 RepID=A0A7V5U1L7_9PROT|nr:hypothetical protein [Hellea balneolensis]